MVIKGVLKEELQNSLQMKKSYERELANIPKGSLIKKRIKGQEYFYIVERKNGKVKFHYKGKELSSDIINKYKKAKQKSYIWRKAEILTRICKHNNNNCSSFSCIYKCRGQCTAGSIRVKVLPALPGKTA